MADAAVEFLLQNLKETVADYKNQLTQGEDVVQWIEYELETLIPQLERIEAAPGLSKEMKELTTSIRDEIRKAEDLTGTFTKKEIQRYDATFIRSIYTVGMWGISKQLHSVKAEIVRYRDLLLEYREQLQLLDSAAPAQEKTVPFYLGRCMHHLLLFPPGDSVPARRLIALWVAEGLVHSKKHSSESVEQIAERYLNELVERKVLLAASRSRSGKVKACTIDAGTRNKLLEEAIKADFFQDGKDKRIRRLVDSKDSSDGAAADSFIQIPITFPLVGNYRDVISFLSFNKREGSKPGEDIGDFLRHCISADYFIWLRVLDLELVFRPKLPDTLGKLITLKYLGLRWTYLEQLPDSVDKLLSLQVLDVKHTYISVLPRSIWRMQFLRHLYLSEAYRTRFPKPPPKVNLTALQTLWGAFVDEDTPVKGGLDRLFNIRKLGLSCRSRPSKAAEMTEQLEDINKWIANLEFLETLRLKSRDENNEAADLRLTSLEGNRKLSTVYLLGKVDSPVLLCKLPVSLTNITLSGSGLEFDPLEFLGRLPNLMILRLLGQSVVCSKMHCSKIGFRQLKLLWIWNLESLKNFEADEGSLPCLEELEIRSCKNLEKLPNPLRKITNLEVRLTSMPQEFVHEQGANYAEVAHLLRDDQCVLRNKQTRFTMETEDLVS